MKFFGGELSEMHKELSVIIKRQDRTEDAKALFSAIHSQLHSADVYMLRSPTETDRLFADFTQEDYAAIPTKDDENAAWVLWHTARIEDLTMNILIAHGEQVLTAERCRKIHSPILDTGNAMTSEEIHNFGKTVDISALKKYRADVGRHTAAIVSALGSADMRSRVRPEDVDKILRVGGVTSDKDSVWLLDYWGKKNTAGLLLMPPTRHIIMHFNACAKWKAHIDSGKKLFIK